MHIKKMVAISLPIGDWSTIMNEWNLFTACLLRRRNPSKDTFNAHAFDHKKIRCAAYYTRGREAHLFPIHANYLIDDQCADIPSKNWSKSHRREPNDTQI